MDKKSLDTGWASPNRIYDRLGYRGYPGGICFLMEQVAAYGKKQCGVAVTAPPQFPLGISLFKVKRLFFYLCCNKVKTILAINQIYRHVKEHVYGNQAYFWPVWP